MTWVVARVIKSDKDAVNVSGEWETKLLNEAHLTQEVGKIAHQAEFRLSMGEIVLVQLGARRR
jgi:hypothetical protein